jgi:hypothetical protein
LTPAKAGLTTVAELGNDSHYDGSDYSGAEVAGSTVVVFNHLPESCKASPKIFHPETSFSSDSTVPRVVNPQQPRKKPSSSDQLIADKSSTSKSDSVVNTSGNKKKSSELRLSIDRTTLKPNDLLTNNEKTGINDFKSGKPAPKTDQPKDKVLIRALPEVVQYGGLKLWAGRLSLLKHDPGALGLIPTSVKDHRFIPTTTKAEVKDLLEASQTLIKKERLGTWEWKEGTSTARLHVFKIPEIGTTISNRKFKFVGFACRGHLGQEPPRIDELDEDISQECNTLR